MIPDYVADLIKRYPTDKNIQALSQVTQARRVGNSPRAKSTKSGQETSEVKPSKYRNTKIKFLDMTFDSKKELNRYCELVQRQLAGEIIYLRRQVRFCVIDASKDERPSHYVADFVYEQLKPIIRQVIEDVKPFDRKTQKHILLPEFKLKWKLMKTRYPGYEYRIY